MPTITSSGAFSYGDVITTGLDNAPNGLSNALRTIYSSELMYTAQPQMIYNQFSERKNEHRLEHGQMAVWTVYRQMAPTIGSLLENVDVDTQQIQNFQVSFGVYEYGNAVGTTEKLDLLSYHGPISGIVRNLLAPQMARSLDRIARNVAWAGAPKYYTGGKTSRAGLTSSDVATIDTIKSAAHQLRMNRVGQTDGGYMAVVHPSVLFDLREDPLWEDAGKYSDPGRLASGEVGRLYGVRFIEADDARLANAGAESAFDANVTNSTVVGSTAISVDVRTNFAAGDEVTLYASSQTNGPDGTGVTEENVIIDSITAGSGTAGVLNLRYGAAIPHTGGATKVRKANDIFPMMFMGSDKPYANSVVQAPEVRVAPPTDKLRRMNYVGWYSLQGWGVIRNWTYLVVETCASQNSAYVFGF